MPIADTLEARPRPEPTLAVFGPRPRAYLEMFNLFRVVACLAVLGQHAFIWTNMSDNFVGTGFITVLHLSRTCFFFLTGLVVCYAQITHPRPLFGFWRRRYVEVGVPYLAWTGIYLVFTLITVDASWNEAGTFLRHNLAYGFSQMYFVIVIFQFYLLFPLLWQLLRATHHHGAVLAASLGLALASGLFEYYPTLFTAGNRVTHAFNSSFPVSRDFLSYQEFFVAGMLVALHFDQVVEFVARRYRQILVTTAVAGGAEVLWYALSVWHGDSLARASDIYQPSATLWCLAAMAGLFALSWWWNQRAARRHARRQSATAYLAALTGGVFFGHTLCLDLIRSALQEAGLRTSLPWEATVAILFVGTVIITGGFIALVLRTPLRWVLGGPVRAAQRASYDPPWQQPERPLATVSVGAFESRAR